MTEPSFARVLTDLRLARGLIQTDLARIINYDRANLSRMEAGKRPPSLGILQALCARLDLTDEERADLLDSARLGPTSRATDPNPALTDALALDAAWLEADDAGRAWIETMIKGVLDGARARMGSPQARVIKLVAPERRTA